MPSIYRVSRLGFSPLFLIGPPMSFLLHQARFFTTVNHLRDLPPTPQPEIAFAGRSNAGKSTAINILCNQKRLAFASKTPGRTQHINYFSVGPADAARRASRRFAGLRLRRSARRRESALAAAALHLPAEPRPALRDDPDDGLAPAAHRTRPDHDRLVRADG